MVFDCRSFSIVVDVGCNFSLIIKCCCKGSIVFLDNVCVIVEGGFGEVMEDVVVLNDC